MKFSSAFAHACRAALQWRLLLVWLVALALPTLLGLSSLHGLLADQLDYSVHATELAQRFDLDMFVDLMPALETRHDVALGATLAILLTLLLLPWLGGVTLAAVRASKALGLRALTRAGASDYWRMWRMTIWSLIPLGIALALGGAARHASVHYSESALLRSSADAAAALASFVGFVILIIAQTTVEAARAQLALNPSERSVIRAWRRGLRVLRRRPLSMLGAFLAITVIGAIAALLLAIVRINVIASDPSRLVVALIVAELIVASIVWMKVARLFVLADLARPTN